ncbi:UNVERIFIED_CONTAM: hypothetical protein NCL1_41025 [Trichonephila clavipes]
MDSQVLWAFAAETSGPGVGELFIMLTPSTQGITSPRWRARPTVSKKIFYIAYKSFKIFPIPLKIQKEYICHSKSDSEIQKNALLTNLARILLIASELSFIAFLTFTDFSPHLPLILFTSPRAMLICIPHNSVTRRGTHAKQRHKAAQELANLALFSNTTKMRLLFIRCKKVSKRRRILSEEIFQLMNKSN